ncbi:hypothetical protein C9J03_17260 [Photobacterium gaetbulicola]|uniref:Uncharacterized protein n=1 Tax=Photobacterium gaetbulicola Gung47 TaxID=658445 RepID=A0A0C5W4K7_9GAMM|nr:hypothetical protein [Photobacterium gaetbulicola]AJR06381.1 hypothetical protein H744_1c1358 [Photobacterium gaetbulicola Gung47]PSU05478.1 hypothetical protein C9J03_17260 [Photobacterium gaetbulicola]
MFFLSLDTNIQYLALSRIKLSCYLLIQSVFFTLFSPAALATVLLHDIDFGDSVSHVRSLPQGFDCSVLYQGNDAESIEQEGAAFCFDETHLFNAEGGLLTAFIADGVVNRMEYTLDMSLANYNAVLAGLRRQHYVFAKVTVGDKTLDVLAGFKEVEQQKLDDQLFTLVNQADFSAARTFILVDNRSFQRALKTGISSVDGWLANKALQKDFARLTMIHITFNTGGIVLQATRPFAGGNGSGRGQ